MTFEDATVKKDWTLIDYWNDSKEQEEYTPQPDALGPPIVELRGCKDGYAVIIETGKASAYSLEPYNLEKFLAFINNAVKEWMETEGLE